MNPEIRRSFILLGIALAAFVINALWKHKTSVSNSTSGFVLWQAFDNWIDIAVYPTVLIWLGMTWGFVTMLVATLLINVVYIKINNSTDVDWTLREYFMGLSWVKKIVLFRIGRIHVGKAIIFALLSFKFDSFYAINFLFGKSVDFKKPQVLILFLTSHAICNIAWTLFWEMLFIPGRLLIELLSG